MSAQRYNSRVSANSNSAKKNIFINNFLGGLAWGLGSVVGAGVIFAIIGTILNIVGLLEPVKNFLEQFKALPKLYK